MQAINDWKCRPIDQWPGELTRDRKRAAFSAKWGQTLDMLNSELRHLHARNVLWQIAVEESEILIDGSRPRATARPEHPGIIMSFESKHGPMRIACDRFNHWQDNMRAIALGLHDLRRLDRYGITKRGEQYTGWKALPGPTVVQAMNVEMAAAFLDPDIAPSIIRNPDVYRDAYRHSAKHHHPDAGGDAEQFKQLQEAKRVLDAHHAESLR